MGKKTVMKPETKVNKRIVMVKKTVTEPRTEYRTRTIMKHAERMETRTVIETRKVYKPMTAEQNSHLARLYGSCKCFALTCDCYG